MPESKELKPGMTASYEIAGKTVVLKPVTLGKMKRAMQAFSKGSDADAFDMMLDHLTEVLANGANDFATREWLADNITLPMANQLINDMRIVNGMGGTDFFKVGAAENGRQVRDLPENTPTPLV